MTDESNPLLAPSTLPYELPDYRAIRAEHYLPAFEAAFAQQRAEVDAITANPDAPTFENTMTALELSGDLLGWVATRSTPCLRRMPRPTSRQSRRPSHH